MLPITVAIADPDFAGVGACERLLRPVRDIWVVAQTESREEAMATARILQPRILLCSFSLAVATEFDLLLALHRECPATRVLLLTHGHEEKDLVMQALNLGAWGYLGRGDLSWQLSEAVHCVDKGEIWVPRHVLGQLLERAAGSFQA